MSFVAGSYVVTFDGSTLGQATDGYEIEESPNAGEGIRGDSMGPSADQDGVYLPGNCYLSCTLMEYDAAALRKFASFPYWNGSALQTTGVAGVPGLAGQLWSSFAKVLVLTRSSGTVASPTTRTCHSAILAPNFPIKYLMSPRHRKIPVRFQLLPTIQSSILRYFTDA